MGSAMDELPSDWEHRAVIRSRFRRELPWLQYPILAPSSKKADLHAPTTRALELNLEALACMLKRCSFEFMDIDRLTKQALLKPLI